MKQNTGRYNNLLLDFNNTNTFVLAGDQSIARLAKDQFLYGTSLREFRETDGSAVYRFKPYHSFL